MEDASPSEESTKPVEKVEFKKPVLFGRIGKLPKKVKSESESISEEKKEEKSSSDSKTDEKTKPKSLLPPAVLLTELSTPIPYKEPKWSGICPDGSEYALEVLKSGMIVEKVDLTQKSYYVFGRLANCDVVMGHPTVSRHHAVLQYKAFATDTEPPPGWYLYELGSTHGTFLNRQRLKNQHYTRVRVGHQIRFGNSTRTYIMLGPDFDCEGESDLTVTEIKQKALTMKLERDRMIKEAIEQRERDRLDEEKRREEQGIDWGMGEDAEDETDLGENPYASTANEELYLEDPKKTLRGYFEREGHELTYDCEERTQGQFICRVELPIDDTHGRPIIAEVIHRGKKKEAVVACALEACRILDRAGLLRQATHESRRRKQRDWSADDYYDSDDDTFLDRTGAIERKRKLRMNKHGDQAEQKPVTYDDLLKQISEIENKIASQEKQLDTLRATSKPKEECASEIDALDEYMTSLGRQGQSMAQKAEISKTKMAIQKLKTELSKTQRLAEIARPAHLPPLVKKGNSIKMGVKMGTNSVVYGKRIKLKEDTLKPKKVVKETRQQDEEFVEEMDSDEEMPDSSEKDTRSKVQGLPKSETKSPSSDTESPQLEPKSPHLEPKSPHLEPKSPPLDSKSPSLEPKSPHLDSKSPRLEPESTKIDSKTDKRIFGPMRPPENYVIPENYFDQESDRDLPEIEESES